MALPRADIREARREARKPPKPPNLSAGVPQAGWGASMSSTGQLQGAQAPLGGATTLGAGQTEGQTYTGGFSTAPGTGPQNSLAAQGSQFGQQAAIDALNQIRGYTSQGLTDAEQGYLNSAIQRGTAQSQAAIRSLAQQAAARGAMDSGGLWAAQGAAAQGGANNAAALGAEAGLNAQQRALGATQSLYGMGQGIDAAAQQRGGAQDALSLSLAGLGVSTAQQDYENALAAARLAAENSPWAKIGSMFGTATDAGLGIGNMMTQRASAIPGARR